MLERNRRAELNYKLDENMERGRRFRGGFLGCWSGENISGKNRVLEMELGVLV